MAKKDGRHYEPAPSGDGTATFRATGSTLFEQVRVLVWLNAVRALRAWKQTLAVVLAPFVVALVLVLLQLLANVVVDKENVFPPAFPVGSIPRCIPGVGPCKTIVYAPATPRVEALLQKVADDNQLQMGVDIVPIPGTQFPAKLTNVSYFANTTLGSADQCRSDSSVLCPPPTFGESAAQLELWASQCAPCDFVADNSTMDAYLQARPNQTQIAVLFVGEYAHDVLKHPTQSYSILRNYSLHTFPFFEDDHALQAKLALDAAALELAANAAGVALPHRPDSPLAASPTVALDVWTRTFPIPLPRVHGYSVAAQNGGIWFFVPACVIFFTLVSELVGEKESKRRVGMRTMGLKNAAFWIAWSVHAGVLSIVSSVLLTIAGWICGFEFFTNTHWLVPPVLLTLFCWAFCGMAFLVSVLVRSQRTAQSIAYTLCLVGFVFQVILCSAYGKLIDLLYGNVAEWVIGVRWGLSVYPAFHLAKAFYAIAALSSSEVDLAAGRVIKGPGFKFDDLFQAREIEFFGMDIHDPAPIESFGLLLANMLIFGGLAMYLDTVLEGDQGTPLHPCWCIGCSRVARKPAPTAVAGAGASRSSASKASLLADDAAINSGSAAADEAVASDPGVVEEAEAAAAAGDAGSRGTDGRAALSVRLLGLRKIYRAPSACCGLSGALQDTGLLPSTCGRGGAVSGWLSFAWGVVCCTRCGTLLSSLRGGKADGAAAADAATVGGSGDVLAVDGISLTIKPGTCLGLLGHNGAGKSTLLKILSGLELPTEGVAEVNGYDVATDVSKVQATLGCCPQHDLQWPEITAREHLQLFARLKGLHGPTSELAVEVDARLNDVNLTEDADRAAGTFSGGMRRRLSVGVACIGSPSVILLDEAATGLDPVNRSELWKMILDLKRAGDKALIVTTHDLQEAELLSDRVAIMGHGRVWCVGSSLDLKGRYGGGYRIAVNAAAGREDDAIAAVARRVPLARLTARDASSLTFAVPLHAVATIAPGLEGLEHEAAAFVGAMREATLTRALEMRDEAIAAAGGAGAGLRPLVADEVADLQSVLEGLSVGAAAVIEAEAEAHGVRAAGAVASVREWNVSLDNLESVFLQVNKRADTIMGRAAAGAETDNADIGMDDEDADLSEAPLAGVLEAAGAHDALRAGDDDMASINSDGAAAGFYGKASSGGTKAGRAAVGGQAADEEEEEEEVDSMGRRVVRSFGMQALCIKNLTLISRQRGMCICQTLTPLIVMGLLVLLQAIIKAEVGAEIINSAPAVVQPFAVNVPANPFAVSGARDSLISAVAGSAWMRAVLGHTTAMPADALDSATSAWAAMSPSDAAGTAARMAALAALEQTRALGSTGRFDASTGRSASRGLARHANGTSLNNGTTDCLEFFLWGAEPGSPAQPEGSGTSVVSATRMTAQSRAELIRLVGGLGKDGRGSGLLGNISQHSCELANETSIQVPYFDPRAGGAKDISVEIVGDLNFLDDVDDKYLDAQPPCDNILECPAYLTPDGSLVFHSLKIPNSDATASSNGGLSFTLAVNDATITRFRRPNNFTRIGFVQKVPDYVSEHADVSQAGRMALVEMLVGAFAGQSGLRRGAVPASTIGVDVSIKLLGSMPYDIVQNLMAIVEIFGGVLWPIALTLQLPLFAFVSVLEKETGLLELQKAMGLRMWQWHAVNYAINFLLYACVVLFFWVSGWALEFHMFTQVPFGLNLLLYVGWGFSLVSLSVALASCLNDRRVATVGGYVVALMGTLIGTVLADGIYGNLPPYSVGGVMPSSLYIFPPFALTRVIYLMTFNCIAKIECPTFENAFGNGLNGEIGSGIVSMYLTGLGYLVVGLYLNEVIASSHSVAQHWAFCLPSAVRPPSCNDMIATLCTALGRRPAAHGAPSASAKRRAGGTAVAATAASGSKPLFGGAMNDSKASAGAATAGAATSSAATDPSACLGDSSPLRGAETPGELFPLFPYSTTAAEAWESAKEEDTEVTDERRRVRAMLENSDTGRGGVTEEHLAEDAAAAASGHVVIMKNLRKVYPGATVAAVQDVSIAIRQGETLAFLGENGCGKSTTVAMVTGGLTPTGGEAWVDGFNVVRDTGEVHLRTGITHQHERLWEDLTCEEHLLFYARLKGVRPARLATEVSEALKAVGLYGVRQRKAGALSGGMRRRLAVAISFSGRSSLCAEDELTTGSDIATRRRLWRVIQNAKTGRSGASAAMTAARGTSADADSTAPKRVLLVVTHLFDEVEALADRVCIVVKGRIRVVGTPAHLKERFGATYRLTVSWPTGVADAADEPGRDRAAGIVSRLFPDARPDVQYDGSATYMIPRVASRTLSAMFGTMTREADVKWFTNWGIGQVTLEDVFASVVHAHNP